ncbi:mannosyltransferase family protein [Streptomyces sp. NBC_01264]|uniref:mannosyltransferase family protein n=1 Tax=Streptomyces sp. NBC_01264 TaxID=2903804 RepID=UPI0022545B61|nr:mannosyltransferase family protein [Streptomyces sp. NBC_01264]MCX4779919.1 glycosyltransferase family 39 protein [Streptomyces sp. NBC_01264]
MATQTLTNGTRPRRFAGRAAGRVPGVLLALGVYAAVRGAGVLAVAVAARWTGRSPLRVLGESWDSVWYLRIAEHGYGRTQIYPGIGSVQSDSAFFPLYPVLIRCASLVLPGSLTVAALAVAWIAAGAAAAGVYRVGEHLLGARAGVLLVALWAVLPHALMVTLAYTEPLLTAFAAWALYALLRGRWGWAAGLAVLAGLTRPTGIAVAAAVTAAAAYEICRRRGRAPAAVWAAGLAAPAGWASYVLLVGVHRGDPLGGYFAVQSGWGSRFDFGAGALRSARHALGSPGSVELATTVTVVLLVAALVLAGLLAADRRIPLPLLVYTGVLLVMTYGGAGFFESKPRFLLPAFPLLLPAAALMAKARPRTAVVVTVVLAGLSYAYGPYLLLASGVAP